MLGILYDIHGNLDALNAVLADADETRADRWLLGGDYGTPSPYPLETLARLRELPNATWIRGNGERWLLEPPEDRPEVTETYERFRGQIPDQEVRWLYSLPPQAELDGVLYVHGSPLADDESFAAEPQEGEERLLAGVRVRPQPSPVPPPGAERHRPRQPRQRWNAARRRSACAVGNVGG